MEIKQSLTAICPEASRALLSALLDTRVPIVSHLDTTAMAVCGRSLKADHPELYTQARRLFQVRNAIAHGKSSQSSDTEMREAVNAAIAVYHWLKGLTNETSEEPA